MKDPGKKFIKVNNYYYYCFMFTILPLVLFLFSVKVWESYHSSMFMPSFIWVAWWYPCSFCSASISGRHLIVITYVILIFFHCFLMKNRLTLLKTIMDSFIKPFFSGSIFGGLIGTLSYFYNHGEVWQIFSIGLLLHFDSASGLFQLKWREV